MGARNRIGIGLYTRVSNLSPARNQVGIVLAYRPTSLCSLAIQFQTRFLESIPRPIAGLKFPTLHRQAESIPIDSLESIPGLLKSLKISSQYSYRESRKLTEIFNL
jgi:hypothetical protein